MKEIPYLVSAHYRIHYEIETELRSPQLIQLVSVLIFETNIFILRLLYG